MAAQFIQNSAALNRTDSRFVEAQRAVDAIASAIAGRGFADVEAEIEKAKHDIADRIGQGEAIT
jgi:hypothetical protein